MGYKIVDPRLHVRTFAQEMELVLRKNDYKGGWEREDYKFFFKKINEEVQEVFRVMRVLIILEKDIDTTAAIGGRLVMEKIRKHLLKECVDVANVVMMLADNYGNLEVDERVEEEDRIHEMQLKGESMLDEHEDFNIYVNAKLEITTNDESEVQPYLDTLPDTCTYAVRDREGVVIEKYAKK